MAKIIIGGKDYLIPELNFTALERAWPYIEESMISIDPMKGASAGLNIIAAGLMEVQGFSPHEYDVPVDLGLLTLTDEDIHRHVVIFLKKKLKASEMSNIAPCINEIIEEAGLGSDEGEQPATGQTTQNPSTETALASSSSSSQPELKEEAGTQ